MTSWTHGSCWLVAMAWAEVGKVLLIMILGK